MLARLMPHHRIEKVERGMELTFWGATSTVTGSRTMVRTGRQRWLVDCGLFQGFKTLRERNWAPMPFDPGHLNGVFLTHAHIDHSGALPLLTRQGYTGRIYMTPATARLCEVLLMDTAHLQEEEARYRNRHKATKHDPAQPLYSVADVKTCLKHIEPVPEGDVLDLGHGVQAQFTPAGHILGAASLRLSHQGRAVLFSGDLGRDDDHVMKPPQTGQSADWVVVESTYGDRLHAEGDPVEQLADIIRRTAARGGVVIIPAFAVGRTQGLLYALYRLKQAGAIPDLPVVLDSPMGITATGIYEQFQFLHRLSQNECEGIRHMTRFVRDVEESKALLGQHYPMVILAGSGMVTGGRVLHHIAHFGTHARNSIVLSGFQAGGTRGASLASGATSLKMFGEYVPIRAEVCQIEGLSAHADQQGLLKWLSGLSQAPQHVFVNHGEPLAADTLRLRIEETLGWHASAPEYGVPYKLGTD